jgi:hypothetical protein
VETRWTSMTSVLEQLDVDEIVLDYIRHYWSSFAGVTRKNDLYPRIKMQTSSRAAALDLADKLDRSARLYSAIVTPDDSVWADFGPDVRGYMETLNLLGMKQIRPLLLAVLSNFSANDVERCMRQAVAWSVRLVVAGDLGGGFIERQYTQRAVEIRKRTLTTANQLRDAMLSVVPPDAQFRSAFAALVAPRPGIARYFLRELDMVASGNRRPQIEISRDPRAANLEHIMPQNPGADWSSIDSDILRSYFNRLGNLALLDTRVNRSVGNASFTDKLEHYGRSPFRLTQMISQSSSWGPAEIESRQDQLARLAVSAWPLA